MKVKEFAEKMNMRVLTGDAGLNRDIYKLYSCDLLSWVMAHAQKGNGWITVHTHVNVVAVALLVEIPCIIIPEGSEVEEVTINKAMDEGIAILSADINSYEICCRAHQLFNQ
ncbi:MAG: hypothetical protein K0R31_1444 [Clostridiales bacterium]|jgi:predicted transcriptional regulator|nr:hypothetical protein [Clostridiales bacterium]